MSFRSSALTRAAVLRAAVVLFSLACQAGAELPLKGLPNAQQVNDHLYRGAQPSEAGIAQLPKLGVRSVIDLRGSGERSGSEEKQVTGIGLKYYNVPLPGLAAPTARQMSTILALIEDPANWPVFLHCERGKDRTGTVIACYRIQHDQWPNTRALEEAREHGMSRLERGMRDFILAFRPAPAGKLSAVSAR